MDKLEAYPTVLRLFARLPLCNTVTAMNENQPNKDAMPLAVKRPVPPIPIDRPISWEDWLKGRKARREISERVAPAGSQRPSSSSDRRLRKLFNGKRNLPFRKTEEL
jgi:hypothetical protein